MGKIRIVSDGTPTGTEIFDAEGKPMENVKLIRIIISADKPATAHLEFVDVDLDVKAEVEGGG